MGKRIGLHFSRLDVRLRGGNRAGWDPRIPEGSTSADEETVESCQIEAKRHCYCILRREVSGERVREEGCED